MEYIIYGIGFLVFVLGFLLVIGLIVQRREKGYMEENMRNIERFIRINKFKKYSRKSTPKVPTIKK